MSLLLQCVFVQYTVARLLNFDNVDREWLCSLYNEACDVLWCSLYVCHLLYCTTIYPVFVEMMR